MSTDRDDARAVYRARPSDGEVADVLAQRLVATVGTVNEDGSVHLAYVLFLHAGGRLFFETSSLTRKARNVQRTGRATLLVQGKAASGRSLMVAIDGTANVWRGERADAINHQLREKYVKHEALDDMDRVLDRLDDVTVEITPRTWRSWEGSVLRGHLQRGLRMPYDDAWLDEE
jgi:PPOX class probable F420-dependent enzyme